MAILSVKSAYTTEESMILSSALIAYTLAESVALTLGIVAGYGAWNITRHYRADYSARSYRLYALSELSGALIRFLLLAKLLLFFYYIFLLDSYTTKLIGAMCATGVVGAIKGGWWLFVWKILVLLLGVIWLFMHHDDLKSEQEPYFRKKFLFYLPILGALLVEFIWSLYALFSLEPQRLVSCCATVFSPQSFQKSGAILDKTPLFALFFSLFIVLLSSYKRHSAGLFVGNALFLAATLWAIIYFFSPYIYALPTHVCPFCLLQKEYYGVGYLIYALLFWGSFLGCAAAARLIYAPKLSSDTIIRLSLALYALVLCILFGYVIGYFLINGTWLG